MPASIIKPHLPPVRSATYCTNFTRPGRGCNNPYDLCNRRSFLRLPVLPFKVDTLPSSGNGRGRGSPRIRAIMAEKIQGNDPGPERRCRYEDLMAHAFSLRPKSGTPIDIVGSVCLLPLRRPLTIAATPEVKLGQTPSGARLCDSHRYRQGRRPP